jgi:hypothetical protein
MIGKNNKKNVNISDDRRKYLKSIKIRKIKILLTQIIVIVTLIAAWEILARIRKNR